MKGSGAQKTKAIFCAQLGIFAFPYLLMVGICTIFSIYIPLFSHFFAIMIRKQEKKSSSCRLVGFCLRRNMRICTRIDRQFSKAHAKCAISGRKNIWNCMERSSQRARRKKKLSSNDFWTKKNCYKHLQRQKNYSQVFTKFRQIQGRLMCS